MDDLAAKPAYGRRVMTDIIDGNARSDPTRPWLFVPRSSSPKDGWKPVTYGDGANAINRVAHKIVANMGVPAEGSFPTIAYIGPSDVRYIMFMFGAVKAGYKVSIPSPILLSRKLSGDTDTRQRPCSSHPATRTRGR